MKRQNNLYSVLISDDNLKKALFEVNLTHRWHPHHKPNKIVLWVESDIPARIKELRQMIEDGFIPSEYNQKRVYGKW